jgi:starch phosphorylase
MAEVVYPIGFGGSVKPSSMKTVNKQSDPAETVRAIAYDTPVIGWRGAASIRCVWRARRWKICTGALQRR